MSESVIVTSRLKTRSSHQTTLSGCQRRIVKNIFLCGFIEEYDPHIQIDDSILDYFLSRDGIHLVTVALIDVAFITS